MQFPVNCGKYGDRVRFAFVAVSHAPVLLSVNGRRQLRIDHRRPPEPKVVGSNPAGRTRLTTIRNESGTVFGTVFHRGIGRAIMNVPR